MKISDLFKQINLLSKEIDYSFRNDKNPNSFKYIKRDGNTNALHFVRIQNGRGSNVTVSARNLTKIANKVRAYVPFQIDVIVGASGNWRSLFESALAYTPQFYICMLNGQRHLVWAPEHPHELNELTDVKDDLLAVFEKQSRYYDYQYFIENCYPYSGVLEDFKSGIVDLLSLFRRFDDNIFSVYDISDSEQMKSLINMAEQQIHTDFHNSLRSNIHFSLYDVAQSYLKFLVAKQYFAFY